MNLKQFFRYFIPIAIGASFLFAAFKLFSFLWPFLVAYVLFFIFKPFVNLLEQRGFNHTISVLLILISAFGILLFLSVFLIPAVASEVSNIQNQLDGYINVLTGKFYQLNTFLSGFSIGLSDLLDEIDITDQVSLYLKDVLVSFFKSIPAFIFSVIPIILYLFVIPFATFFYLYDEVKIKKKIIGLVPNRYFETTLLLLHKLNLQFGLLLRGMFTSAFIISLLSSAGLWMIDLEYPIIVGIFAGVSNLIPYFGPIVGTVAAFLVAIMTSMPPIFFVKIILVFLAVNLIDNVFVQPIIMARAANLHPLIVIFLVLLGSHLGGIIGMLIAVPLASLLQVILKIIFVEIKRPRRTDFSKYNIK